MPSSSSRSHTRRTRLGGFGAGLLVGLAIVALVVPAVAGRDPRPSDALAATGPAGPGAVSAVPGSDDPGASGAGAADQDAAPSEEGTSPAGEGASGAGGGGSAASPAPGAAPPSGAGAPAAGGEVRLGVVVLDLAAVSRTGLGTATAETSVAETTGYFQFFADEVNAGGGIAGRPITLSIATFDPLNDATARRACLQLTEDDRVFAVVLPSGFPAESVLCFSEEHRTPTLAFGGEADEWYRRSGGRLFTASMAGARNARALVRRLHADGVLEGRTIGIVSTDSPTERQPVDGGLVPELRALGYTVAHRSTITQNTEQQPSQIPVEISQMRRAGVDQIFWLTHALVFAQWTQQSDAQGYRPSYALTDIQAGSNDFTVENVPSTTKAVVLTGNRDGEHHAGLPEPAKDADCRLRYERSTGTEVERGSSDYFTVLRACAWIELFSRAAAAAAGGGALTPDGFVAAMQGVSRFDFAWMGPGSFGPGKFDFADGVRLKRYQSGCRCWMPAEDFRPAPPHAGYR